MSGYIEAPVFTSGYIVNHDNFSLNEQSYILKNCVHCMNKSYTSKNICEYCGAPFKY